MDSKQLIINRTRDKEGIKNKEKIKALQQSKYPIFIYGAAHTAQRITEMLKENNIEIEGYLLDDQYWNSNKVINERKIINRKDAIKSYKNFNIVIGFYEYGKAIKLMNEKILQEKGEIIFFNEMEIETLSQQEIIENIDKLSLIYDELSDEVSREIFLAYLQDRISGIPQNLIKYYSPLQYFPDIIEPDKRKKGETFVDCGSYDGATIFDFIKWCQGNYKKIYAFEPEKKNFEITKKNLKGKSNIELINKGAWFKKDILYFTPNNDNSHIDKKGTVNIEVESIDNIIGQTYVSFIKMDIEGSELEALKGAEFTIKSCFPKLAICIYHKKEDILLIPDYIRSFNNKEWKYDIYLRHHSLAFTETVLYAIPKRLCGTK